MLTGALKRLCRLFLLRFQISPAYCGPKTFYPLSGVAGKHLMRFQSEISVFKFLRCSVDGKHLMRYQWEPLFSNSSGAVWTENI